MNLYTEEIVGYSIVIIIINYPKSKRQIEFLKVAYILGFYTNLVCLKKLNNKGVF